MPTHTNLKEDKEMKEFVFRDRLINNIRWSSYLICLTLVILFTPPLMGFLFWCGILFVMIYEFKQSKKRMKQYFDDRYEIKVEKRKK